MTKYEDLKTISEARLKTAKTLIDAGDWIVSAYIMGCVLECALKAMVCKTLCLPSYPPTSKSENKKIETFFRTHEFDSLLIVSGLLDVFGFGKQFYNNWSAFTQEYLGQWTDMRYEANNQNKEWDETKINFVYNELNTLIGEIKKRW